MNEIDTITQASSDVNEFLAFRLGSEEYGIDILAVQEIRGYDSVTRLPEAPEFIKGIINLRGTIVPVVDLRIKFKLGEPVYDAFTVMIVLQVEGRVVGIVVDSVSDVVRLKPQDIAPPPEFGAAFDTRYLMGLSKIEDRMLILVSIAKLIKAADFALYARKNAGETEELAAA